MSTGVAKAFEHQYDRDMPQRAAPAYLRLHAGVFARCSAGSGARVRTDVPGLRDTSGLTSQGRPALGAADPAAPVAPERPDTTATDTANTATTAELQRHVLDAVRAGLVADARGWAARVRLLRAWQAAPVSGERFDPPPNTSPNWYRTKA